MARALHRALPYLTAASGCLLALAGVARFLHFPLLMSAALLAAAFVALLPIVSKALQALRMRAFSIELLVSIAAIGALAIGEYVEAAAVSFLFLFGAHLEARTLRKTRAFLKELIDLAPQEAVVLRAGIERTVPARDVQVGERVVVRSGSRIPVDGRIRFGEAAVEEAAITGEAIPAQKKPGDRVYNGTIVDAGYLELEAERIGDDTAFAKLIELVEEAQEAKSNAQQFLDRFAAFYTPAIVAFSLIAFALTRDVHLAITFLVVACPGALVIGAPISRVAGIGNGAKHGVLIKGGEAMEALAKTDVLLVDKTGTLTKGKPDVTALYPLAPFDATSLLQIAAEAERASEHHLGRAILQRAQREHLPLREPIASRIVKGSGIQAVVGEASIAIGNRLLMQSVGVSIPERAEEEAHAREKKGETAMFAAVDKRLAGVISVADPIRDDVPIALAQLRESGIATVAMLTGDNPRTAQAVAEALGLDAFRAEQLPEDKVAFVRELQRAGHTVAMVGDGINDAPAIAAADIGLAMGESGTDISMETADVVLMADRWTQFAHAYDLAKATDRNIKQNIAFALTTALVLLVGVSFGSVHLASGMFVHEASVLLVIVNAMRLLRFTSERRSS